jgi:hypothetical protein
MKTLIALERSKHNDFDGKIFGLGCDFIGGIAGCKQQF